MGSASVSTGIFICGSFLWFLAVGGLARLLEIRDEVGALLRVRHASIGHGGAWNSLHGRGEEAVEGFGVPDDAGALHGGGIVEAFDAAGTAPHQSAVARADAVIGERVAGGAARIELLAALRVARRLRCAHGKRGGGGEGNAKHVRPRRRRAPGSRRAHCAAPPSAWPRRRGCWPPPWKDRGWRTAAPRRGRR